MHIFVKVSKRHNRLSTAWVQLTQSLYQRLLMWYTGLPVRQSQSSNLFSLVQSKGKRKKGSLAITRESWEEVSDWSKSSPVQFGEVVFSLKIRTQTALWYQTQLIWEVGWVVPNFNKTRWQVVMSLPFDSKQYKTQFVYDTNATEPAHSTLMCDGFVDFKWYKTLWGEWIS